MAQIPPVLVTFEKKFVAWFDPTHIFLIIALVAALCAGVWFYQGKQVSIAEGKAAVAEATLKQAVQDAKESAAANATFQAQKDQVISQLQEANANLAAANSKLTDAIKAQSAALVTQQSTDKKMSPTEQSQRWSQLVPGAVVAPTTAGFTVDPVGGLNTVLQLEQVPVLTTQLAETQQQYQNAQMEYSNANGMYQAEVAKRDGDNANSAFQLAASNDRTNKVQADFTVYKHKAWKRLVTVYVAGVASGIVLTRWLGF